MNALNTLTLFVATYLAVFFSAYWELPRRLIGTQVDLLPALVVYGGLRASLPALTSLAIFGGLLFDSLSGNPLGTSVVSLFAVGYAVHHNRERIVREQPYAQFILGAAASLVVPLLSLALILSGSSSPLVGWGTLWQLIVMTLAGGAFAPLCFWFFDRADRVFGYERISETTFRPDREIKRGR